MNYKLIYDVVKTGGFCGHNMADETFTDNGSCAWKSGSFEMRQGDPECSLENCPFIKMLKEKEASLRGNNNHNSPK